MTKLRSLLWVIFSSGLAHLTNSSCPHSSPRQLARTVNNWKEKSRWELVRSLLLSALLVVQLPESTTIPSNFTRQPLQSRTYKYRVFQLEVSFWFIRKTRLLFKKSFDFYFIQYREVCGRFHLRLLRYPNLKAIFEVKLHRDLIFFLKTRYGILKYHFYPSKLFLSFSDIFFFLGDIV